MADEKRVFASGEPLFFEGQPASSIFFIKKGAVSIVKNHGKTQIEVGKAIANQVIGELSFFDKKNRSESAIAMTYVEAVEISFQTLESTYATVPDYLKTIMSVMAARLQVANDTIHKLEIAAK